MGGSTRRSGPCRGSGERAFDESGSSFEYGLLGTEARRSQFHLGGNRRTSGRHHGTLDRIEMTKVDLSQFDNSWYDPGRSLGVRIAWFFFGLPILRCGWLPSSAVRRGVLRLFGAKVGHGVVIKPGVRVKFPWLLELGENSWIGEDVWLDNLA